MRASVKAMAVAIGLAGALQAPVASAQYMMHLDPNLYILATMNYGVGVDPCMTGTAMSEAKIAEARTPAPATMQAYFDAALNGGPKSSAFHLDKNTAWRGGGVTAGSLDLDGQTDPLAVPGNVLEPEPLRFYRGGTGATALGQWAVLDAQGQVAGVYTALFARIKKVWKLRELTISQAHETVEPAAQYCRKPGDVMEHRLTSTRNWRESAQKRVDEARAELAEATAAEEKARLAAAAKPRERGLALVARDAERRLASWTKQLSQREKNLSQAIEKSAEAQNDADELKRLTGEARNALALRTSAEETPTAN